MLNDQILVLSVQLVVQFELLVLFVQLVVQLLVLFVQLRLLIVSLLLPFAPVIENVYDFLWWQGSLQYLCL